MILQKCSIWRVAEIFFKEPTKLHFIHSISKKIKLAPTSVKNHVISLQEQGIIEKVKSDPFSGYKAKRENPEFIFNKKISNLIQIQSSGIVEALNQNYPKSIILFGSYNRGEDIESSDIDLFIDSKNKSISEDSMSSPLL